MEEVGTNKVWVRRCNQTEPEILNMMGLKQQLVITIIIITTSLISFIGIAIATSFIVTITVIIIIIKSATVD